MNIRPLGNRVVVRDDKPSKKSKEGIIELLPGSEEKPAMGTVIAVGPGKYNMHDELVPVNIKVNDRVVFTKNAGEIVEVGGENLRVVTEDHIIGVLS